MDGLGDHFVIQMQIGEKVYNVVARIDAAVLELSWETFSEQYVEPAFKQLIAEMKYQLEQAAPDPAAPAR